MNRPIHFRAWDGEKMHCNEDALFIDNSWWYGKSEYDTPPLGAYSGNDEAVIMQFTGLLDRNGKEIFEGDVVEHRNYIKELLGKYEVRWGLFGFTLHDPLHPELLSYYVSPEQLEIIGNIYENPELIK